MMQLARTLPPSGLDLSGQSFGRLVVLERATSRRSRSGAAVTRWWCRCSCESLVVIDTSNLRTGTARSCGCLKRDTMARIGKRARRHGMSYDTPEYVSWKAMLRRCYSVTYIAFANYGGRGIRVCERWRHSFVAFVADLGPRPVRMTLDRIDVDGDYEPDNCRWATRREQRLNQRRMLQLEYEGRRLT